MLVEQELKEEKERQEAEERDRALALQIESGIVSKEASARAGFYDSDDDNQFLDSSEGRIPISLRSSGTMGAERDGDDADGGDGGSSGGVSSSVASATDDGPLVHIRQMELRMSNTKTNQMEECSICLMPFDESVREGQKMAMSCCGKVASCVGCFSQYIKVKIKEQDVTPWVICPDKSCQKPIPPKDFFGNLLTDRELFKMIQILMDKRLHQESQWYQCSHEGCRFGFLVTDEKKFKKQKNVTCEICSVSQATSTILQSKGSKNDSEYQAMVREGKLRPCPKCGYMAMKDYGICNIIQCGHCNIWWNWRTRETGRTKDGLKNQARNHGTLWEPGELEYQQNLEHSDKEAFKKLLNDNGIRYNPFYTRGH